MAVGPQSTAIDQRQTISVVIFDPSTGTWKFPGGSGGTSAADESAFGYGTSSFTPIGGVAAGSVAAVAAGDAIAVKISPSTRAMAVELVSPTGTTAMDTANDAVRVNVVAGAAGGGVAQTQVRTASNTWFDVGYNSGDLLMPILVSSIGAGVVATTTFTNTVINASLLGPTPSGNNWIGIISATIPVTASVNIVNTPDVHVTNVPTVTASLVGAVPSGNNWIGIVSATTPGTVTVTFSNAVVNASLVGPTPSGNNYIGNVTSSVPGLLTIVGSIWTANGGSGGTSDTDQSSFTIGTTSGTPMQALVASSVGAVPTMSAATPRMSSNRVMYQIIRDGAGNERGANVTAANELLVSVNTIGAAISASLLGATPSGGNYIGQVTATLVGAAVNASLVGPVPSGNNWIGIVNATIPGTQTVTFTNTALNASIVGAVPSGNNWIGIVSATIPGTQTVTFSGAVINASLVGPTPSGNNWIGNVSSSISGTPNTMANLIDQTGHRVNITPSGYVYVDLAGTARVPTTAVIQTAATGLTTIAPAPAAGRVQLYAGAIIANAEVVMSLVSPTQTYLTGSLSVATYGGFVFNSQVGSPIFTGAAAATVYLNLSASVNVGGWVSYWIDNP